MIEIRKKQKRLRIIMKTLIVSTVIYFVIFLGVQPMIAAKSNAASVILTYIFDAMIISSMIILFAYYSKYGKADLYLTTIEHELSDVGYYLTSRQQKDSKEYCDAVADDLSECGFSVDRKIEIDDFDFDIRAYKSKEYFYTALVDDLNKNDMLAYSDSAFNDITVQKLKRKGNGVILFITDKAQDDAVAISKVVTTFGKKEQLKVSYAIAELSTGRVYFLGNMPTKCQQMTANYVMNCDVPIKDEFKGTERLKYQDKLEEKMQSFTLSQYKNGTFYAH